MLQLATEDTLGMKISKFFDFLKRSKKSKTVSKQRPKNRLNEYKKLIIEKN